MGLILYFYDYNFNIKTIEFTPWLTEKEKQIEINPQLKFNEISVPTIDSSRMIYLMNLLIKNKQNILTPGEIGTGKSTNAFYLMT